MAVALRTGEVSRGLYWLSTGTASTSAYTVVVSKDGYTYVPLRLAGNTKALEEPELKLEDVDETEIPF